MWVAVCDDDQSTGCQAHDARSSESASHARCVSSARRNDAREAEQRTAQVEQALEQIGPPFVAHTEAAAPQQPGQRALHHPAVSSESFGGVDPTSRNPRRNATSAQGTAEVRGIVGLIGVEFGRSLARPARSPARSDDRGNVVDQRERLRGVVGIGGREADRQRDAVAIDNQVVLGAKLAPVDRVRTGLLAPLLARALRLSRLARLQSMAASSPNQFSSVSCSRCQTPACCQSRSRRQQVVALPQPSSLGSNRQGQPVRRTKMMPPRAARSGLCGRPPFGLGGSLGSRGPMASQRSSGTRDVAFMVCHHATPPRFCNTLLACDLTPSGRLREGSAAPSRANPAHRGVDS